MGADTPSGPRLTETGITVGTPTYMSPEQAAGDEELTGRSDQYALAAVIYEALAGVVPFTGRNARAILARKLTSAPRPLKDVRPDVPEAVERVLMRALSRHPAECHESMETLRGQLDGPRLPVLHWGMRPETRRNRNPLSTDHAFT
jgi:serine/threonine protein kinase